MIMENPEEPELPARDATEPMIGAGHSASSVRSIALVVIRIFAIWSIFGSVMMLIGSVPAMWFNPGVSWLVLFVHVMQPVFWAFVFVKAGLLTDRFFDDEPLRFSVNLELAVRLGVILLGLNFLIEGLSGLASQLALRSIVFEPMSQYPIYDHADKAQLLRAALTMLCGALLAGFNERIAELAAGREASEEGSRSAE